MIGDRAVQRAEWGRYGRANHELERIASVDREAHTDDGEREARLRAVAYGLQSARKGRRSF